MGKMCLFSLVFSFLRNGAREPLAAQHLQAAVRVRLRRLRAARSAAARCVFVAFLLGFFPQVFIPFILRWS